MALEPCCDLATSRELSGPLSESRVGEINLSASTKPAKQNARPPRPRPITRPITRCRIEPSTNATADAIPVWSGGVISSSGGGVRFLRLLPETRPTVYPEREIHQGGG
jgi:hypothetical protein